MTKNHTGLPNAEPIIDTLQIQLATSFDLYSQLKQAHWNLKGPGFIELHKMFDDMAAEMEKFVDEIAERIGALGGYPMGYLSAAAAASKLDNPVDNLIQDLDWVAFILDQYHHYSTMLYTDIETVAQNDPVSQDLLIAIARTVDKGIYFLAGHLEDDTSADAYETGSDNNEANEVEGVSGDEGDVTL